MTLKNVPYEYPFWRNLSPSDNRHGDGPFNSNRPTDPIFVLNTTARRTDPLGKFPVFRMELNIYPAYSFFRKDSPISHRTLADYPFDRYHAVLVVLFT